MDEDLGTMITDFRVAILGLGGVGGYFGAKLAGHYSTSNNVQVIFLARGENEKIIRSNGLKLITPQGDQIVSPSLVSSNPAEIGFVDLLICCVKSYDLETSILSLKPCINDSTIILPLLNGVDASERIKNIFRDTQVWQGCAYLISRLIAPGVVRQTGGLSSLHFGSENSDKEGLHYCETLFMSAGIDAHLSDNITRTMWEKFLFISTIATVTSSLDLCIGDILTNPQHKELLTNLLTELKAMADAKKIPLPQNIVQATMDKFATLPYESTSSMHSDFQKGGRTEVDSLTGYVARLGKELHIATPYYDLMLDDLLNKSRRIDR